uniref:Uncharacterized protein n=1 Tax=Arundo donax TaxID=35708 RepID=A0A0A8Z7I9_ARUDO
MLHETGRSSLVKIHERRCFSVAADTTGAAHSFVYLLWQPR